ncbi:MAG: ABC transporter permease [Actinobacteria bacterium]|nr:MAG: ABC transporter permease [Actinomycetota bacterium]
MNVFIHELRGEMKLYSRSRELAFFTFMLPLIFFVLLGSVYGSGDKINGYRAADYLLTGMIGYGLIATAFAGLAIVLVIRRENGVLKRLRATPLPAPFYIAAVLLTTLIAFAVMAACLIALGMILFGASFPKAPVSLVATLILGGATFAALGVAITGFIRRAEGASAVINAIYLPVAFISGAFFSQKHFPEVLQKVADVLPLTYFIDLVGDVMLKGTQIWSEPKDVAVILVWGIAGALLALRYFRWVPRED